MENESGVLDREAARFKGSRQHRTHPGKKAKSRNERRPAAIQAFNKVKEKNKFGT